MIRIAGVNIPTNKKIRIALTYIYGIGDYTSIQICNKANININDSILNLPDYKIIKIRKIIDSFYFVEGNLKVKISLNIKNLIDIKSYRGIRHVKKLPTRGQRTHTNARTRKGKAIAIAGKKKVTK